jgi:hypothetical protein
LRHVFRTIADGARDIPVVRPIMGHADAGIDDARLRAVADRVGDWLWPKPQVAAPKTR